ncbi:HIT family protein [bacterium]|nr:MAG: HIT family protein [bacterium]
MECIFCNIVENKIPVHKVYEDNFTLAFLDIAPVNPGHTLVILKKHIENIEEASEEDLCNLIKTVKKVGNAIKTGLKVSGYNVNVNNGSVAGQVISHIHFHIYPRLEGDGHHPTWVLGKYKEGEAEEIANKIKIPMKLKSSN